MHFSKGVMKKLVLILYMKTNMVGKAPQDRRQMG